MRRVPENPSQLHATEAEARGERVVVVSRIACVCMIAILFWCSGSREVRFVIQLPYTYHRTYLSSLKRG
jgi:hypothetical protein